MPRLTIDHREVEVPPGATVLDAARRLGIDIPTLCFRDGCDAATSCLVCMVKLVRQGRLVPACATSAAEGMEVESETEEVRQVRRRGLGTPPERSRRRLFGPVLVRLPGAS